MEKLVDSHRKKLEEVAAMSSEQAKDILLKAMEEEARYEGAKMIRRIEQESREAADKKSQGNYCIIGKAFFRGLCGRTYHFRGESA